MPPLKHLLKKTKTEFKTIANFWNTKIKSEVKYKNK